MQSSKYLGLIRTYFENTLKNHGSSAKGVDWNSEEARALRFDQLIKIVPPGMEFTLLDYGSGYGAFADYMSAKGYPCTRYYGYDIADGMVGEGRRLHPDQPNLVFTTNLAELPSVDYAVSCGVFNMKQKTNYDEWTSFVLECLLEMNGKASLGFSVNFLTKYSDPERMRPDLYYADPCFLFDYCKTHFSRNVALLHDYNLHDFTLLIRKG